MKLLSLILLTLSILPLSSKDWEKDIAALEAKSTKAEVKSGGYLFVGSSSIRMWDLKKSFPAWATINHGFGGSELSDSIQYADRIVIPFAPKVVFLYAGDNDVSKGKSAEVVIADFKTFSAKIQKALPKTKVVYLPIKPSLSRWKLWPEMNKANLAIKEFAGKSEGLDYLDTATPMLGEDGKPMPDLFKKDGLHMNEKGYAIWNKVVIDWVNGQK